MQKKALENQLKQAKKELGDKDFKIEEFMKKFEET